MRAVGVEGVKRLVDFDIPSSEWLEIDQNRIDTFAECTNDAQWIHVDPARAQAGPFGTTIAHGFLTLSLIPYFWEQVITFEGFRTSINYGLNEVRFPAPVPVGSRLRALFTVREVTEVDGGVQLIFASKVEREGHSKPVCVAERIIRLYL
jgi:acyl dehydratase